MTKELKIILYILLGIVGIQGTSYAFEFISPWVGIIIGIASCLGIAQLIGLVRLEKLTKLFKDDENI